jgi:Protein of unknown function (DUF3500)
MKRLISSRVTLAAAATVVLIAGTLIAADRSATAMSTAAARFLDSLTPEQRHQASFGFAADERLRWHFIPTEMFPRKGLPVRDMTPAQRTLARDLLRASLSQRGYMTATQIMDLENVLGAIEAVQRRQGTSAEAARAMERDPEKYFFSVFGTPSPKDTWGWRVEGHHVSLHFNVINGTLVAAAPTFFGSNPAEVRDGPKKGLRILGSEEDAARALLESLDAAQRDKAVFKKDAPGDILTMATVKIDPLAPDGIAAAALTAAQRELLRKLIAVYAGYMTADVAAARLERMKRAGEDRIVFAWAGPMERGQKHYYRVQGPTFLIEYDNTQNDGNHIHSVWRDFNGDFGQDLLREHLRTVQH